MGSATFALPSLDALLEAGYSIGAVITQPDKPSGRGQTVQGPPVKKRALDLRLQVHQPSSLKTDETRRLFETVAADMIVVVAYGKIIPGWLLRLPKHGCINLHGSLLPKYRGAAPVHWAVANGDEKTGVCTMLLDEGLDTGAVYLCEETPIAPEETVAELYNRLAAIGAPLLVRTLSGILNGTLGPAPQDHSNATLAPPLKRSDGYINWTQTANEIHNRVRAFNPWPGTVTRFRGQTCKILKTTTGGERPASGPVLEEPGLIIPAKGRLLVMCGNGVPLEILSIQPENRKAISGRDFANGSRLQPGEKFESLFEPLMDN